MKLFSFFLFFFSFANFNFVFAQEILILGKNINLNDSSNQYKFTYKDSLYQEDLKKIDAIFIFSTSCSNLKTETINSIVEYVYEGGNLYLGAENYPFLSESNEILQKMYNLQFYGDFSADTMEFSSVSTLNKKENCSIETGYSTVSVPLDYRLKVEAWSNDNPIILSGEYGQGKVILDGGYSRFYDLNKNELMLNQILDFFTK